MAHRVLFSAAWWPPFTDSSTAVRSCDSGNSMDSQDMDPVYSTSDGVVLD
jgi:hypothetical protein